VAEKPAKKPAVPTFTAASGPKSTLEVLKNDYINGESSDEREDFISLEIRRHSNQPE